MPVELEIAGREVVEQARGHPHARSGVRGDNHYEFHGIARVKSTRYDLDLDAAAPIAALATTRKVYVLAQYRSGDQWLPKFRWLTAVDRTMVEVSEYEVEAGCREVALRDPAKDREYRLWRVDQEIGRNPGTGCRLLLSFAQENPRFAFQPKPPRHHPDTLLPDLLLGRLGRAECDLASTLKALQLMLESAREEDWSPDIHFLAHAIRTVGGAQSIPYLRTLYEQWGREKDSERAQTIGSYLQMHEPE